MVYYQRLLAEVRLQDTPHWQNLSNAPHYTKPRELHWDCESPEHPLGKGVRVEDDTGKRKGQKSRKAPDGRPPGSRRAGQHYYRRPPSGAASSKGPHPCLPLLNSKGPSFASAPRFLLLHLTSTSVTFQINVLLQFKKKKYCRNIRENEIWVAFGQ